MPNQTNPDFYVIYCRADWGDCEVYCFSTSLRETIARLPWGVSIMGVERAS